MQETFKKDSGHMNVQHVTDDFLIFTLLKFKATKKLRKTLKATSTQDNDVKKYQGQAVNFKN